MEKTSKPFILTNLKENPAEWLIQKDNPSVRAVALKELLGRSDSSRDVRRAKQDIMSMGPVPKILSKQHPEGFWGKPEDFYSRAKYKGTAWTLILLSELMADGKDERIRKACEFILEWPQDRESGGFAYRGSKKGGGHHSGVLPCLTGNMVCCLIRFGYLEDPRVQRGIEWITTYQRCDNGESQPPKVWPYKKFKACWGRHTCLPGVVKGIKALSEIPTKKRTKAIKSFIEEAAEFILKHRLYKRSHDPSQVAKHKWTKLWFPWMWDTDVLEMLLILTGLGIKEKRMKDAVDLVVNKQDEKGRWPLEASYTGRFQVPIERKNRPSKWITLHALRVLQRFYG
jgi:hypothetical protein